MVVGSMIAVKDITTSSLTVDGNEKINIDFTNLSSVIEGDTMFLSVFGNELETSSISSSTTELWIDWIVANYNVKASNSTATRNNKVLEILANDSTESNLTIDTGNQ
jgi:hypothetical protein